MSENLRILLVGATGLIGRTIIARSPDLAGIVLQGVARREIPFPEGVRMELVLADTDAWPSVITQLEPDAVISALGTTRKKAGSDTAFAAVDHDLVLEVAKAAKAVNVRNFVQVSSVGADPYSKNTYLKVKGEAEADLRKLRMRRLDLLRPGLLRGKRRNDLRVAEKAGQFIAPLADLFLRGDSAKYRSIRAGSVADAALACAMARAGGQFVHEHDGIMRLAREFERGLAAAAAAEEVA